MHLRNYNLGMFEPTKRSFEMDVSILCALK